MARNFVLLCSALIGLVAVGFLYICSINNGSSQNTTSHHQRDSSSGDPSQHGEGSSGGDSHDDDPALQTADSLLKDMASCTVELNAAHCCLSVSIAGLDFGLCAEVGIREDGDEGQLNAAAKFTGQIGDFRVDTGDVWLVKDGELQPGCADFGIAVAKVSVCLTLSDLHINNGYVHVCVGMTGSVTVILTASFTGKFACVYIPIPQTITGKRLLGASDIGETTLATISKKTLNVLYLGKAVNFPNHFPADGLIWGHTLRLLVNMPVKSPKQAAGSPAINVLFLVDTGFPGTATLTSGAIEVVFEGISSKPTQASGAPLLIHDADEVTVYQSPHTHSTVNLIGMKFLMRKHVSILLRDEKVRLASSHWFDAEVEHEDAQSDEGISNESAPSRDFYRGTGGEAQSDTGGNGDNSASRGVGAEG